MRLEIVNQFPREVAQELARTIVKDLGGPIGVCDVRVEDGTVSFDVPSFPEEDARVMRWLTSYFEGTGLSFAVPDFPGGFQFTIA
jgi:hypothetical protein